MLGETSGAPRVGAPAQGADGLLGLWYRLSAPPQPAPSSRLEARERGRRGRVASLIIGGLLLTVVGGAIDLPLARASLPSLFLLLACLVVAIPLNRAGRVDTVGWLLTLGIDGALIAALIGAHGGLDPLYLPAFYLMATALLVAASLLRPSTIFPVTALNCLFIILDTRFQPHTMMWDQMITSPSILYSLILGPVALHIAVALVAYLWTNSALTALRRADRAEEVARLERREQEMRHELEEGIQRILATHVRFANGDLSARAPMQREHALWQVSVALNNLLARYQRLAQEDGFGRIATEQVGQTRMALRMWQARQQPHWPNPVGTPLDPLLADLRTLFGAATPPSAPLPFPSGPSDYLRGYPSGPSGGLSGYPPMGHSPYPTDTASPGALPAPYPPLYPQDNQRSPRVE